MDCSVDFGFGGYFRFDVVLDLIIFGFQVLENSGLLNDVIGKFLPLHISISVDVDLIEEVSQVPNKSSLSIGEFNLPEPEVLG